MEIKVEGGKRTQTFISMVLPSMLRQLGIEKSKKTLYIKVANECGADSGATINFDMIDSYVIVIKPNRNLVQIGLTLAHELVHVRQMIKGTLKCANRGKYVWAGKMYGKNTKYLNRPWELDAFARQEIILRRALEE